MNNFLHQRSVEAKGRRDEENGLFIPRELLTNSVENFREFPKVYDNYVKYFAQERFAYRIIRWQVINPMQTIKKLTFLKLKDSQKAPVCPDPQHISGGAGSTPSTLTDDACIQNKVCFSCFIQSHSGF